MNKTTPINIKLKVLNSCMFSSFLYSAESWWNIDIFSKQLSTLELKALKRILGVKKGTPNHLVYIELKRPCIIAQIKALHYKFFNDKIMKHSENDALVKNLLNICIEYNLNIIKYYNSLKNDHIHEDKTNQHILYNYVKSLSKFYPYFF